MKTSSARQCKVVMVAKDFASNGNCSIEVMPHSEAIAASDSTMPNPPSTNKDPFAILLLMLATIPLLMANLLACHINKDPVAKVGFKKELHVSMWIAAVSTLESFKVA